MHSTDLDSGPKSVSLETGSRHPSGYMFHLNAKEREKEFFNEGGKLYRQRLRHTSRKEVDEHRSRATARDGIDSGFFSQAYIEFISGADGVAVGNFHDRPRCEPL